MENIKLLLGIIDAKEDAKLQYILNTCERKVLRYIGKTISEIDEEIKDIIVEFAILRYNKIGSEGLQSESYNDVSNNFSTDIPADLKKQLNGYRKLKTL